MGKQWGTCVLGIFLGACIVAVLSKGFWVSLERGTGSSILAVLTYLGIVVGAVAVLGTVSWGYNRLYGSSRPIVYHFWGATLVVIALAVVVGFLKVFFTAL
jgi:hypothetical protein